MNSEMTSKMTSKLAQHLTRREILQSAAAFTGGTLLSHFFPATVLRAATVARAPQAAPPQDAAAAFRAQMAAIPLQTQALADNITLLSGPGGNVVVLNGPDGKLMVDDFVAPAWAKLKESLDAIGSAPVKFVINTHWHFDHTDNNAPLHSAGATIIAHDNTKKRMSESHDLPVLGLHFPPSPAGALPGKTFSDTHKMQVNRETLTLTHMPPAHTDTDIYIHFQKANVLHCGDLFFNGLYPYIDPSTGGSISGMIASCDKLASMADNNTKVVPGHGPLGDKADVIRFRDMLSTVRDRVGKLKSSGKSMQEAVAAKPLTDLDQVWGKAFFNGETFVQIAYSAM